MIYIYIYIYIIFVFLWVCVWSYACHGARCGVTTSHSTSCGCCVRDYHICFRLFSLSVLPCQRCVGKIHKGGWHNSAGSSSGSQVKWVARLSSNTKKRKNSLQTNNKNGFLLKYVCETIKNKLTMFVFLAKRRRKNIERGRGKMRTLMSVKSGTLNFCKV